MDIEWLESLEEQVKEAARRLAELRSENDTLKSRLTEREAGGDDSMARRVRELENQITEARATLDRYEKERGEVRRRVESLTRKLEGLVS